MSRESTRLNVDELPAPICEICGFPIEEEPQECVARDDGRCAP